MCRHPEVVHTKTFNMAVLSPLEGRVVPITAVPDQAFSEGMLGRGVAIEPSRGRIVAPAKGQVSLMFETGHAVTILSSTGAEILIHVGIDTVNLHGRYFSARVKTGDSVSPGDLLLEFDMTMISKAGYELITPVVICNFGDFSKIDTFAGRLAGELDEIIRITR